MPHSAQVPFSRQLRDWRRSQRIKQETLAAQLGVTQAAVSRWENGLDEPSAHLRGRLRGLMAAAIHDDLGVERLLLARMPGRRALFDLDGLRLVGLSPDLQRQCPDHLRLMGRRQQDHAVGEVRRILDDAVLIRNIRQGQVALISGTSVENLRLHRPLIKHNWHLGFRTVGRHMIADFIYADASPQDVVGIHSILRMDEI